MKTKYSISNLDMVYAHFNLNVINQIEHPSISQIDEIIIQNATDTFIELQVSRQIVISPEEEPLAHAILGLRIKTDKPETADSFRTAIKNGVPALNNAFAQLSLVISQMTSHSFLGPVITYPKYDTESIAVQIASSN